MQHNILPVSQIQLGDIPRTNDTSMVHVLLAHDCVYWFPPKKSGHCSVNELFDTLRCMAAVRQT